MALNEEEENEIEESDADETDLPPFDEQLLERVKKLEVVMRRLLVELQDLGIELQL